MKPSVTTALRRTGEVVCALLLVVPFTTLAATSFLLLGIIRIAQASEQRRRGHADTP